MTLETKYNIGDQLWFFYDGHTWMLPVISLAVLWDGKTQKVIYGFKDEREALEEDVFNNSNDYIKSRTKK